MTASAARGSAAAMRSPAEPDGPDPERGVVGDERRGRAEEHGVAHRVEHVGALTA